MKDFRHWWPKFTIPTAKELAVFASVYSPAQVRQVGVESAARPICSGLPRCLTNWEVLRSKQRDSRLARPTHETSDGNSMSRKHFVPQTGPRILHNTLPSSGQDVLHSHQTA